MRYNELIEGNNSKCIVVDVQPEYTGINDGDELYWIDDLMSFLNKQGPILMFVNAEDQQLTNDTVYDIKQYWEDSGFDPAQWQKVELVDKGYGYLRDWIDYPYSNDKLIIQTIREMYRQKVNDSRDLFNGNKNKQLKFYSNMGQEDTYFIESSIVVEWTSIAQLKRFSGAYIMGGGRNECLAEIRLLMNAFNIRYKEINEFIY